MVEDPDLLAPLYIEAGCELIILHVESTKHLDRSLNRILEVGAKAGVTLNPATPVENVEHVLHLVDQVLIMSVNPGFGGQSFIPTVQSKIERLVEAITNQVKAGGRDVQIQIDGGVKSHNIAEIASWGVTNFVVGSALFNDKASVAENLSEIMTCLG